MVDNSSPSLSLDATADATARLSTEVAELKAQNECLKADSKRQFFRGMAIGFALCLIFTGVNGLLRG